MGELRKDYILERWVEIVLKRGQRPHEFRQAEEIVQPQACLFCPGSEEQTPPEINRVSGSDGKWKIRTFPNKFAAVEPIGNSAVRGQKFFQSSANYGYHEVIVETSDHSKQLADLSVEEIVLVLREYIERIRILSGQDGVQYVAVFKNHGSKGGTSLIHSHSQIIAYNIVPSLIQQELAATLEHCKCPYCDIIAAEAKSERRISETENIAAFCPYASRFNYEAWIFPKRHTNALSMFTDAELKDTAAALKNVLQHLQKMNASYNYYLHYHPDYEYHFHIEITPRIATWAGFEYCTDTIINSVPPEEAAAYYRSKI
ncbi:MAG TPA: DUF4931 domain-containing protein [Candidatus Nanoarchaeia archaeon]|nr:DUF4931 domain-containing protein [Candidatus Nanoarchaeia archaeon]